MSRTTRRSLLVLAAAILALHHPAALAQHSDIALENQASFSAKPWHGGSIALGEKVRFADGISRFTQSKTSLLAQQTIGSRWLDLNDLRLRLGIGYTFIDRLTDGTYYEYQHRLTAQAAITWSYGHWRFGSRARLQSTFRDQQRGSYRYNPKLALRLRLSALYSMPDRPWRFGTYAEGFYRANDPRGAFVDEIRLTLFADYRIDRHQTLTLYIKYFNEMQVADPLHMTVAGLGYTYEL